MQAFLLQLYELNENNFKVVGDIYSSLSQASRLIVPAQAAREFALNRAKKIAQVTAMLEGDSNKIAELSLSSIPFLEEDRDYKANALNQLRTFFNWGEIHV